MQRVVRTRKNGWKKPFNTFFVSRPTKYGNPFKLEKGNIYGDASHRTGDQYPWILIEPAPENIHARLVELYREWLAGNNPWTLSRFRSLIRISWRSLPAMTWLATVRWIDRAMQMCCWK
jgi:hypothetical protein